MFWWLAGIVVAVAAAGLLTWRRLSVAAPRGRRPDPGYPADRYDLQDLLSRLGMTADELSRCPEPVYRCVQIPKRSGGFRRLEIPDPATLALQRRILRRLLSGLRCHAAAVGFEPGLNIVDAAWPHVGKRVVIRIDIRQFFESTSSERVAEWFRHIGWNAEATAFLVKMVTCNGHLPQGAATSPRLSNLVNARMDAALQSLATRFRGDYTRYADDITLSFNIRSGRRLRGIIQIVRRILKQAGYQLHGRKTRVLRRHQRQQVLGLTVNDKVQLPRQLRRRLRAIRHHAETDRTTTLTPAELQGWTAYELMVQASADDRSDAAE